MKSINELDVTEWIPTKFYFYTSSVREKFAKYVDMGENYRMGEVRVKEVFEHYLRVCNTYYSIDRGLKKITNMGLSDNKITIELTSIQTGEKLYIGQYDWEYSLGTDVWSEFKKSIDFGVKNNIKE